MEDIVFFEGQQGIGGLIQEDYKSITKYRGMFNCILLDDLYTNPEKVISVMYIKPKYIYLNTTGLFIDKIDMIMGFYKISEYLPYGVIFGSERTALLFKGRLSELDKNNTLKYYYWEDGLKPIEWMNN